MREDTKEFYNLIMMQHKIIHQRMEAWKKKENDNYNAFELADASYALREMIKLSEDTTKELRKLENMSHAKCGVICMTAGTTKDPIKTEYCTAVVKVKQIPELPKLHKDPERYHTFMEFMKIPSHLIDEDMIRLNWKPFVAWLNRRTAEGFPLPKGLDISKIVTTAELQIRKKKEIEFIRATGRNC